MTKDHLLTRTEGVWQHNFGGFEEAKKEIARWIGWYNGERPHQALGYLSPAAFRQKQRQTVV